jgi:hypothetical protein
MNREPICASFMGFKELCTGVPQNTLWDAKWPELFFDIYMSKGYYIIL